MTLRSSLLACALLSSPAVAEAPRVVADIAPVHSLVAQVMAGAGVPDLILPPGASPHGYAMRPSEAEALDAADVVFHTGGGLAPWLDGALGTLAGDARVVALSDVPGTVRLPLRETAVFGGADDHDHDHDHDHGHDHDKGFDPHTWLDPKNAETWLAAIAEELAGADPENAALYRANATKAAVGIDAVAQRILIFLVPHQSKRFVVFHDAYQYFEARFGLRPVGAISLSDATPPGPARLAELRAALTEGNVVCVFAEPQFDPGLIEAVTAGADIGAAVIDPMGADIPPGPDFYGKLLERIAGAIGGCL